jgi:fluoride exporter
MAFTRDCRLEGAMAMSKGYLGWSAQQDVRMLLNTADGDLMLMISRRTSRFRRSERPHFASRLFASNFIRPVRQPLILQDCTRTHYVRSRYGQALIVPRSVRTLRYIKEMAFLLEPPRYAADDAYAQPGRGGVVVCKACPQRRKDRYMWKSVVAISVGASLGALLRWWLGVKLNSHFPSIPPGTLAANLIGGYVIGLAIAFFASYSVLAPEWRLLVVTGFCGGLTTFSTYSAELVALLQEGRALWACGAAAVHLAGSVLMTFAGIGTVVWVKG